MLLEAKQQNSRIPKPTVSQSTSMKHKRTASISTKRLLSQHKKSKRADNDSGSSYMENDSDDAECIYRGELWSECKDDMIQCTACLKWTHAVCTGIKMTDSFGIKLVVC